MLINWTVEPGRDPGDVQRLGRVNCLAKGALMKLPFEQTASNIRVSASPRQKRHEFMV
jgi:hypothetical protein